MSLKSKFSATFIVAMANAGSNTQSSQFFICTETDAEGLNSYPNYTQFGKVVEGMYGRVQSQVQQMLADACQRIMREFVSELEEWLRS